MSDAQKLRILVVGASGTLGSAIVDELKPRHEIITAGSNLSGGGFGVLTGVGNELSTLCDLTGSLGLASISLAFSIRLFSLSNDSLVGSAANPALHSPIASS